MNKDIFREYDIRGLADTDLTDETTRTLGRGLGTYLNQFNAEKIAVGRDVRLSSERLRNAIVSGLLSTGLDVLDIGECPTPMLYYALHRLDVDGGIMITGSHNPADYNGFKISVGRDTIHSYQIQEVRTIVESGRFLKGTGREERQSLREDYIQEITRSFGKLSRPIRVVVDAGNGTAGIAAVDIYRNMGCEVIPLYCEIDGSFPNHHPDPTVEKYLEDLIKVTREREADLGLGFDGDSDRLGVIDDAGQIIWGDEIMVLFSRQILRQRPGATFVAEVKCSQRLYDDISKNGGTAVMWKAGHSLIKAKMKEVDAVMGGEMSGHLFFADRYFGFDDAIYAGARMLELCAGTDQKLSTQLSDLPETWSTPEIRADCPEDCKFEVVKRLTQELSEEHETVTVDGVRVLFDDGWGLVRASNTQPAIVLRFEASSQERLDKIRSMIEEKLKRQIDGVCPGG
jgi:phosphomannomutase/phosphoglucomutase